MVSGVEQVSDAVKAAAHERLLALRDQHAAQALAELPPSAAMASPSLVPATNMATQDTPGVRVPGDLIIATDNQNTQANSFRGSALAEPAGANLGAAVFATGNFDHASFSSDAGVTWFDLSPTFAPPAGTNFLCCDSDVMIDDARRVTFYSALYLNFAQTTGAVRIFVLRFPDQGFYNCFYDFVVPNVVLDYPHLGMTKRSLYFTANAIGPPGTRAEMRRMSLDAMAGCGSTPVELVQWSAGIEGQRVWVPIGGTNNSETMFWAHNVNAGTIRLFWWDENSSFAFQAARAVAASNFAPPDCRGGVNNTNYVGVLDTSPISFNVRGTLTAIRNDTIAGFGPAYNHGVVWYWPVGPGPGRPQGFVRAALFRDIAGGLALHSQPDIFNADTCFQFPIVTANKRGDVGITLAFGGRAGGGGGIATAVRGGIGISDEFTGGNGFFANIFLGADGTHNPANGRYGDYMTIHPNEPCEKWFSATSYALFGGTGVADVNSRWLEFGREQSLRCWDPTAP